MGARATMALVLIGSGGILVGILAAVVWVHVTGDRHESHPRTSPGTCPAALGPSDRPGPHLCGPLCQEWLRIEEIASLARAGHVDRGGAASQLETYAWHAQALGETAQARARELRRRAHPFDEPHAKENP